MPCPDHCPWGSLALHPPPVSPVGPPQLSAVPPHSPPPLQDVQRCLNALEELGALQVTSQILQRNTDVVATLKKVRWGPSSGRGRWQARQGSAQGAWVPCHSSPGSRRTPVRWQARVPVSTALCSWEGAARGGGAGGGPVAGVRPAASPEPGLLRARSAVTRPTRR